MLIVSKKLWAVEGKIVPILKKCFVRSRCVANMKRNTSRQWSLQEMRFANELETLVRTHKRFNAMSHCDSDARALTPD